MKKLAYTVHLNIDIGANERNDFIIHVRGRNVMDAVRRARFHMLGEGYTPEELDDGCEILEVYRGHINSLWNRPKQKPLKGRI